MEMIHFRFNFEYDPKHSTLLGTLFLGSSISAVLANMFVIYIAWRIRSCYRSLSYQLITSLALTDIVSGVATFLAVVLRFSLGYPGSFESTFFCPVFGFSTMIFSSISMLLVSFLALERYLLICHRRSIPHIIIWSIFSVVACAYCTAGIGTSLANTFSPDPTFTYCWPNGSLWANMLNLILTVTFVVSLFVLLFCYISIFVTCYRWNHPPRGSKEHVKIEETRVSRRGSVRALLFIAFYSLFFLPKVASTIWQACFGSSSHPFIFYTLGPFGISLSTAINPLMVIFLHTQFKQEAVDIFYPPSDYENNLEDGTLTNE